MYINENNVYLNKLTRIFFKVAVFYRYVDDIVFVKQGRLLLVVLLDKYNDTCRHPRFTDIMSSA